MTPVVVLGAGITGLTVAFRLKQRGRDVLVLEAEDRAGGCIRTYVGDGYVAELGPSTLRTTAATDALCHDLGLDRDELVANPRAPRYIARGGRAIRLSPGPSALLAPIVSWSGKARAIGDLLGGRPATSDESVDSFFTRRFGREVAQYLAGPFVSGVYAGDPASVSVKSAFPALWKAEQSGRGVIRGMLASRDAGPRFRRRTVSFKEGLGSLPGALSARLGGALELGTAATSIALGGGGRFLVGTSRGHAVPASDVVCTLPEAAVASLLEELAPEASKALGEIQRVRLATLAISYQRSSFAVAPEGFGVLVPRSERLRLLGCFFSGSLFPGRAPEGAVLLSCFAGGALDPAVVDMGDEELRALARDETRQLLGASGEPRLVAIGRWQGAIPQYEIGHSRRTETVEQATASLPGLHLCGNWRDGVSLAERIAAAEDVAERILTS